MHPPRTAESTKVPRADRLGGTATDEEDRLTAEKIITAFRSLPRIIQLVMKAQPFFTISLAVLYLIQGVIPAATAYAVAQLINAVVVAVKVQGRGDTTSIVIDYVILQFAIQGVGSLLTTLSNIIQQLLQERMSVTVQMLIMEKANTLDLAFFEDARFYDTLQRAQNEASSRPTGMVTQTFGVGRTIVTFISMVLILVHLAWWLALLALIAPIPAFYANIRYGWWGYQVMRRQSPERRAMTYFGQLMTTDTYNKEIKLFTLGDFFIKRYRNLALGFYDQARRILVPRYLTSFGLGMISLVMNGGIYVYVALRAVAGAIQIGGLTLYTQAALQLGSSFQTLLGTVSGTYENNLYINTLFEFLEYTPHIANPTAGRVPEGEGLAVEFRHVTFTYPGREHEGPAIRDVSFTIEAGEAVALVGGNGAGKTTIVKLLTRLYDPDEGMILINGHDIREYDLPTLRARVGVIFQDYVTYYMTAAQNIGIGRIDQIEDHQQVVGAATKSGASAVIEKLPEGYSTMLGKWFSGGQQLSGGEWQKIALARAFMRDAQLLILDEPTSSLDPQAEYEVFTHFRELTAGKSAVFISHRFSTVRLANRIIVLEHGQVQEIGTHEELLARDGRYAELFSLQAEAYR